MLSNCPKRFLPLCVKNLCFILFFVPTKSHNLCVVRLRGCMKQHTSCLPDFRAAFFSLLLDHPLEALLCVVAHFWREQLDTTATPHCANQALT